MNESSMKKINKNIINKYKRKSDFQKNNKIRLELFSLEQKEINEKQKLKKDNFSYSSNSLGQQKQEKNKKADEKKNSDDKNENLSDNSSELSDDFS